MRHLLTFVIISIFIASCASTPPQKSDDILADIENSDFLPSKTISYVPKNDKFSDDISSLDSISTESINRLPAPKLEKISEDNGPIDSSISLCYQNKFELAFKVLDKAYEKYKDHPGYWNQIGSCYLLKNELRKALLYYNKSLGIKSDYAPAVNNFGVLYLKDGKDQLAIEAFRKAAEINSFSLTPIFNLSHIYLKYGALNKAYNILSVLYKKNKDDVDVISALASYNLMIGNIKNALKFYELIDDDYLVRSDISLNYAYALRLNNNKEEALSVFRKISPANISSNKSYYLKIKKYVEN